METNCVWNSMELVWITMDLYGNHVFVWKLGFCMEVFVWRLVVPFLGFS